MAFNPPLGSTSPDVLVGNVKRLDELVNGPAADVPDRAGDPLYSWRQIMVMAADVLAAYQESGGVLAFADEQKLLAYTPDKPNVLALDSATGAYWFWDGTAWHKSAWQNGNEKQQNKGIQGCLVGLHELMLALVEVQNVLESHEGDFEEQRQLHQSLIHI